MKRRRELVLGAAGFVGSHPYRRLVAEGDDVVAHDDLSAGLGYLADGAVRFEADVLDPVGIEGLARTVAAFLSANEEVQARI
jgi:nucleoside-diphosphate-sugar epimerase